MFYQSQYQYSLHLINTINQSINNIIDHKEALYKEYNDHYLSKK